MSYLENLNNIPDEMKKLNCWCCFDLVKDIDGKIVKRIYNPNSTPKGRFIPYAKANDSSTWASFDKAVSFCKKNNLKGLSFALSKENGIHCVDLDHCKSAGGDFSALAYDLLGKSQNGYTELSQSQNGLHFFFKAQPNEFALVKKANHANGIECYSEAKFISMTGIPFGSSKSELVTANFDFLKICKENLGTVNAFSNLTQKSSNQYRYKNRSDDQVIEAIRKSKKGDIFDRLYAGEDIKNNHSESDFMLCNILAFFTDCNAEQMERIFKSSGLYREEKWNNGYGRRTIDNAISTLHKRIGRGPR